MKKAVIITKSCKICGLHFETKDTKRGRKKETCSKACASKLAYKKQQVTEKCCRCGKNTTTSKSVINSNLPIYCEHCKSLRYEKQCLMCKKQFFASHNETFLCSKECKTAYNQQNLVSLTCDYCGKEYEQARFNVYSNANHYCSQRCNHNAYATRNRFRYGKTWYSWTKIIKERDDYKCLLCGSVDDLEVHHFTKLTSFEHPDDAHYDNNLGTFCHNCHKIIESTNIKSLSEFNERYSQNS